MLKKGTLFAGWENRSSSYAWPRHGLVGWVGGLVGGWVGWLVGAGWLGLVGWVAGWLVG